MFGEGKTYTVYIYIPNGGPMVIYHVKHLELNKSKSME